MNEKTVRNKTRLYIATIIILVVLIIIAVLGTDLIIKDTKPIEADFSQIERICELATLKCYYHDVAEWIKEPDWLFRYGLFQYGYKKLWIEYDGIVEIGINVRDVKIEEPDKNGRIRIYVPEATVLGIDADTDTMQDIISETGVLTDITFKDKAEAYAYAQSVMKENATSDEGLLRRAKDNAKELLKQYVLNVGELMGKKFTVEFIDIVDTVAGS